MVHFEVILFNTQTYQGKTVMVQAYDAAGAFKKARMMQVQPGRWATLTAKPQGIFTTKFKHKGLASR